MPITQITVGWQETVNTGDYSNARPSMSMTHTLQDGEDPAIVRAALADEVRAYVQELADQALEANGRPARYWAGQRYDLLSTRIGKTNYIIIVPAEVEIEGAYRVGGGMRIDYARNYVKVNYTHAELIDCSDGEIAMVTTLLDGLRRDDKAVYATERAQAAQAAQGEPAATEVQDDTEAF